jgi:hypothetical protein
MFENDNLLWVWRLDTSGFTTFDALCQNVKRLAPAVTGLVVKTSDYTPEAGAQWIGYWDTAADGLKNAGDLQRWVTTAASYGLTIHAWSVPRGLDVNAEVDLISQACNVEGVQSMILDVEPYEGFWSGGKAGIRPFMVKLWRKIPHTFHIGLSVDPRIQHYHTVYPDEWYPFVFSVHPQNYWRTFNRLPEVTIADAQAVWTQFKRPIVPILQGNAPTAEINRARALVTGGMSWWRLGVVSDQQLQALGG